MIIDYYTTKIFPTKIFFKDLINDNEINKPLESEIIKLSKVEQSLQLSNVKGWHSNTNLHHKNEFSFIKNKIESFLQGIYEVNNIAGVSEITAMWANINSEGCSNSIHVHPNSIFSGVYYVTYPENSGHLYFKDPRPGCEMVKPNYTSSADEFYTKQPFIGAPGMCFIFPSWMPHGVEINNTKENRISISFNVR